MKCLHCHYDHPANAQFCPTTGKQIHIRGSKRRGLVLVSILLVAAVGLIYFFLGSSLGGNLLREFVEPTEPLRSENPIASAKDKNENGELISTATAIVEDLEEGSDPTATQVEESEDLLGVWPDYFNVPSSEFNPLSIITESGLEYYIVFPGIGSATKDGDMVVVHYALALQNGTVIETTVDRQPYRFYLGSGTIFSGFGEGVTGMRPGETRLLIISPDLGYGENGFPPLIPGDATTKIMVTLLDPITSGSGPSPESGATPLLDYSFLPQGTTDNGLPYIGDPNAPVTMLIYENVDCPNCKIHFDGIEVSLINEFIATGQVRLIIYTVAFAHERSLPGGKALLCATEQDKFWEYRNRLFRHHEEWDSQQEQFVLYATDLGLDLQIFSACLDEERLGTELINRTSQAIHEGVSAVPTTVIDDEIFVGVIPFETQIVAGLFGLRHRLLTHLGFVPAP